METTTPCMNYCIINLPEVSGPTSLQVCFDANLQGQMQLISIMLSFLYFPPHINFGKKKSQVSVIVSTT